jgi:hypothetical protein
MSLQDKCYRPCCLSRPWAACRRFRQFPPREGDGASGGATIIRFVARSLSRTRAPHGAIAGVFLTAPAALCGCRLLSRRVHRYGEACGGRSGPGGHAPGGRLVVAAGRSPGAARVREERPLPAAGGASDPTRMTPHESALWRTEHIGLKSRLESRTPSRLSLPGLTRQSMMTCSAGSIS